ncbi:SPOSA6832_05034 [Sporobolomyces salmonicolor]|uniref:Carboxylic ester hydrolase n=1 Tax=Sporidiobolus salmonicolor TaxID=5005 RepID=A0A0D6EU43_SPOSA|nr:SPOSA6832_05034 [Sporobolomyces salmonicolor]
MPSSAVTHFFATFALLGFLASCCSALAIQTTWEPVIYTSKGAAPVAVDAFSSSYDASELPNACPQFTQTSQNQSEDCLDLTIYVPKTAASTSKLPVFFWNFGGSFYSGESSALDGFALANAEVSLRWCVGGVACRLMFDLLQNMIVVTANYRLGILGWLKYDKYSLEGNLGLKDLIMALEFVQSDIANFGGDPALVTLAGQSSGAQMITSLLSTPSASSLFKRAIMQSPPLDYADQTVSVANNFAQYINSEFFGCRNWNCFQHLSLDTILSAQEAIVYYASLSQYAGYGVPAAEPFQTVVDGTLVTSQYRDLVASGGTPSVEKELLFTTVKDEACLAVASIFPNVQTNASVFTESVDQYFPTRASTILNSGLYNPSLLPDDEDAVRDQLLRLDTDFFWCVVFISCLSCAAAYLRCDFDRTCPVQQIAVNTTTAYSYNGKVWLGEFDLGISYYDNEIPYCVGRVDHQCVCSSFRTLSICPDMVIAARRDDIDVVFNSPPSAPTSAQSKLIKEVQARWASFARTGNPNTSGYITWAPVASSKGDLNVLLLGGASDGSSTMTTSQRTEECKIYTTA